MVDQEESQPVHFIRSKIKDVLAQAKEKQQQQPPLGSVPPAGTMDFLAFSSLPAEPPPANDSLDAPSPAAADPASHSSYAHTQFDFGAPWASQFYPQHNFGLLLHQEILDFCAFVSPRPEEHQARLDLIARLRGLVLELWPRAKVEPFGSFVTNTYLPSSDVDVVVFGATDSITQNKLDILADALTEAKLVSYIEVIAKARVPIVKFTDRQSGLQVDISFDIDGGLQSAQLVQQKMREYPALRPMVLVVKQLLQNRRLNETYSGGFGSFLVQMMVLSFLQQHPCRQQSRHAATWDQDVSLGCMLLAFLKLYGIDFNFDQLGISVLHGGKYFKKKARNWFNADRPFLMSFENPLDPSHDIGANSYNIAQIKRAFRWCFHHLLAAASSAGKADSDGIVTSPLARILRLPDYLIRDRTGIQPLPSPAARKRQNVIEIMDSDEEVLQEKSTGGLHGDGHDAVLEEGKNDLRQPRDNDNEEPQGIQSVGVGGHSYAVQQQTGRQETQASKAKTKKQERRKRDVQELKKQPHDRPVKRQRIGSGEGTKPSIQLRAENADTRKKTPLVSQVKASSDMHARPVINLIDEPSSSAAAINLFDEPPPSAAPLPIETSASNSKRTSRKRKKKPRAQRMSSAHMLPGFTKKTAKNKHGEHVSSWVQKPQELILSRTIFNDQQKGGGGRRRKRSSSSKKRRRKD
eukprot:g82450.t1